MEIFGIVITFGLIMTVLGYILKIIGMTQSKFGRFCLLFLIAFFLIIILMSVFG